MSVEVCKMEKKKAAVNIEGIKTQEEIEFCARLRASSDPWVTLQRDYDAAISSLTAPDHEVYTAKVDDDIAGFAVISVTGAMVGFLLTLCIVPEFQGCRIGSKLLEFCEKRILQESPNVFIFVSSFNTSAQEFYFKHGYKKVGELDDYVIEGYSELLLRKSIAARNDFFKSKH